MRVILVRSIPEKISLKTSKFITPSLFAQSYIVRYQVKRCYLIKSFIQRLSYFRLGDAILVYLH